MGRGGTVLGIIGILLGAGAIGFAFVVWNTQNTMTNEFNNLPRIIVVGIWDEIDDNQDYAPYNLQAYWLFEFGGNSLSDTDYISVSNNNTRITLLKSGWYRIHLSVLLVNIDPSNGYLITIIKNGATEFYLDNYGTPAIGAVSFYDVDSFAFVHSNGTNYIEISGYSNDGFWPSIALYNQLTIEFVVT